MNKVLRVAIWTSLLILIFGAAVSTVTPAQAAGPDQQKIDCKELRLEPGSDVTAPEFEVVIQPNGITFRGTSTVPAGTTLKGYEWAVDSQKCTYRTKRLANSIGATKESNEHTVTAPPLVAGMSAATGNYYVGYKVVSLDPPGFWLAATDNRLWWTTYSDGTVRWYQYSKGCTGYTTPLNTHWYNSSCSWSDPYYSGNRQVVYSTVAGTYYNYDFMDPNQRTDASHYSVITGYNNGTWSPTWSATHSGEYWWLLRGQFVPD